MHPEALPTLVLPVACARTPGVVVQMPCVGGGSADGEVDPFTVPRHAKGVLRSHSPERHDDSGKCIMRGAFRRLAPRVASC